MSWTFCKTNGEEVYYGQHIAKGQPEGLVRYIWADGTIYEGNFSKGRLDGFGVIYKDDLILCGWMKEGARIGNFIDCYGEDMKVY